MSAAGREDPELHPTLLRQLRRIGLSPGNPPANQEQWGEVLARVDQAYRESRHDTYLLQRSLAMVSAEMSELAEQVRSSAQAELSVADKMIRRLALAVEASVDAIVITDPDAAIEYVNPAFTTVTGWGREEVIGGNPRILKSGQTPAETYQEMWRTLSQGELWSGRLRNRRKPNPADPLGGKAFWALITISPYFDQDGTTLLGYVAIQRDISDSVAREERHKLAAQVTRMRADIAGHLHSALPLADRLAEVAGTTSQALQAITGDQWSTVVSVSLPETLQSASGPELSPRWRPDLEARLGQSLALLDGPRLLQATSGPGGSAPAALVAPSPAGSQTPALIVSLTEGESALDPILLESLALSAELTALAASADRATRDLERARDVAESATRAKAQFLATMSHEIRTPMNGVIGMLNILGESTLNPAQREQLGLARSSAESLLTIINDILDFSKIEAGKIQLESVPFDVCSLTEQVTALFKAQASGRDVQIGTVIAPGVPERVLGDPTRLRQVLTNVVGNSVKFTTHGHVTVRLRPADPDPLAPPPKPGTRPLTLVFEVADSGIGMDPETMSNLFRPFSQADASMTRRFGGTGLGLAITGQLVELMSGDISVSSSLGAGTNFVVRLPFQPAGAPALAPPVRAPGQGLVGRVLLVEDNLINQKVARSMLAKLGVAVDVACDGAQALARLASDDGYGLVLMDCQMPVLDGFAATRSYREREPAGRHLPIIALTANALVGAQDECRRAGMDGYLSKPYSREDLEAVLSRWLGESAATR